MAFEMIIMIFDNYCLKLWMEMERFETFHLSENLATITEPVQNCTSKRAQ